MARVHRVLLIATFLPLCWFWMMAVHELGHVFAAWSSGGTVTKVVLHPLTISRTDVQPNPTPNAVVWAGPIVGCLLPLLGLYVSGLRPSTFHFLFRFFAGFCLIANGAYIAFASLDRVGDAGDMLKHGTPTWCLWLFGAFTIPLGLACWHKIGPEFGFGSSNGKVNVTASYLSLALLVLTLTLEFTLSPAA